MKRSVLRILLLKEDGSLLVDRLSNDVDDTTQSLWSNGHLDGSPGVDALLSADETIRTFHGNGTDGVLSEMLGDLQDETLASLLHLDLKGIEDLWEFFIKLHIDDGSNHLGHLPYTGQGGGAAIETGPP
jgi:hypothetical protein